MSIDQSKILSSYPEEYCDMLEKELSDYTLHGVHVSGYASTKRGESPIEVLAKEVPDNAEVVVIYRIHFVDNMYFASGDALIPK